MSIEKTLKRLESKSEYIIREANFKFKNLGLLWSGGKDSSLIIALARQSLPTHQFEEMPIIFLNTSFQFQDTLDFIEKLSDEWGFGYKEVKMKSEFVPTKEYDGKVDRFACCSSRKTEALCHALKEFKMDAVMVGIRRDEQEIRNKERFYSPRDTEGKWDVWHQPIEMQGWELFVEDNPSKKHHMRVHPILEWTEIDVWDYMKLRNIPVNPIYFSEDETTRFRSIGCKPCTVHMTSDASNIDEILKELEEIGGSERDGRAIDANMERLRALGYMSWFIIFLNLFSFIFGGVM